MKLRSLSVFLFVLIFAASPVFSQNLKVIEEKVISVDNPGWWDDVVVRKPRPAKTLRLAKREMDGIESSIDGKSPDGVDDDIWTKMCLKKYVYFARLYRNYYPLSAAAYFRAGELYKNLDDLKRARTAYYNARAKYDEVEKEDRDNKFDRTIDKRIEEMNEILDKRNNNLILQEKPE